MKWKKRRKRIWIIKNNIFRHKRAMTLQKKKLIHFFMWLETWIHLCHLLFDSLHRSKRVPGNSNSMLLFNTTYHAIRTVGKKCFLREGRDLFCEKYCIIVQMVNSDGKDNKCLSLKTWTIANKTIYCAWTRNNVEYLVLIFINRLSVDHLHRNVNCLTSHFCEWCLPIVRIEIFLHFRFLHCFLDHNLSFQDN